MIDNQKNKGEYQKMKVSNVGSRSAYLRAIAVSLILAAALLAPASAAATAPSIASTSASGITTSEATLNALIDPQGKATGYHFEYGPADCEANPCTATPVPDGTVPTQVKGTGTLTAGSGEVTNLTTSLGAFAPGQAISGEGIEPGTKVLAVTATTLALSKGATQSGSATLTATGPQPVSAQLQGLTPHTTYHLRVIAIHKGEAKGEVKGPDTPFATFATPQVFGPCSDDALRTGLPSAALPDCRAYEQATPVGKDAGDATGTKAFVRSSLSGNAISFLTVSGMPGAKGSQEFPPYLATRSSEGWSTVGLLPPASLGQQAKVIGWTPEFSDVFVQATQLGEPPATTFLAAAPGQDPTALTPYLPSLEPGFAGAAADGSVVEFESRLAIPGLAGAIEGKPNLYLWDRETEEVRLAGVMNDGQPPANGAIAGPYDWFTGTTPIALGRGGAKEGYYLQDANALSAEGTALFFTAAGTGQLYERLNPTQPQSALDGEGECTEAQMACTINVSASKRSKPDPAGDRPAAFMAASTDGSKALFTSSQMLTDDANTGPEQTPAEIQGADLSAEDPQDTTHTVVPTTHAKGIATDGTYLYWADPGNGSIGRSKLDGSEPDDSFIVPGSAQIPQYVAVAEGHLYWTAIAPGELPQQDLKPDHGDGTIGKAKLNGAGPASEVDPTFVTDAAAPQGIAVHGEYVYWANRNEIVQEEGVGFVRSGATIGRAKLTGEDADEKFIRIDQTKHPIGIAVDDSRIYWSFDWGGTGSIHDSLVESASLDGTELNGGKARGLFIGGIQSEENNRTEVRGIALDGTYLYWAAEGTDKIGRIPLDRIDGNLEGEAEELELLHTDGAPIGLALQGTQLYWSSNGESLPNPGNDLYRYDRESGALTDLAPDSSSLDGIEVQGVLGASADASSVYFAANGVPDNLTGSPNARGEVAEAGDCHKLAGSCNLYLASGGEVRFIARLDNGGSRPDATNWVPKPQGIFPGYTQKTARVSADGQTLLFSSQRQLSDYANAGTPELYLYRAGTGTLDCVSCNPTGGAPSGVPSLGQINTPVVIPTPPASVLSHNLSAEGTRVLFDTTDALVPADTNGQGGCPVVGSILQKFSACTDVYEWEAVGTGSCEAADENADGGCVYLISTGKGSEPQLLADASASGNDVFFFTRSQLVGQDQDQLTDVYDARVGGGLTGQYPTASEPCPSAEACKGSIGEVPSVPAPPHLVGPGNPPRKTCPKGKRLVGKRCVNKHHRHHRHHKHRRSR